MDEDIRAVIILLAYIVFVSFIVGWSATSRQAPELSEDPPALSGYSHDSE